MDYPNNSRNSWKYWHKKVALTRHRQFIFKLSLTHGSFLFLHQNHSPDAHVLASQHWITDFLASSVLLAILLNLVMLVFEKKDTVFKVLCFYLKILNDFSFSIFLEHLNVSHLVLKFCAFLIFTITFHRCVYHTNTSPLISQVWSMLSFSHVITSYFLC